MVDCIEGAKFSPERVNRKHCRKGRRKPFKRPMEMSRKLFTCLALSLFALTWATPADAQRFRWWKDEDFTRELALSPDQSSRIEAVFQAAQPELRAQHRAVSKLEDELSKLVQEARVEESEVEHFVGKVESARADLAKTRMMMIYRIRRILTTDQHTKLQSLLERREKERRSKNRGDK
jgi:Spy/CpxP family protein refolding chaperone